MKYLWIEIIAFMLILSCNNFKKRLDSKFLIKDKWAKKCFVLDDLQKLKSFWDNDSTSRAERKFLWVYPYITSNENNCIGLYGFNQSTTKTYNNSIISDSPFLFFREGVYIYPGSKEKAEKIFESFRALHKNEFSSFELSEIKTQFIQGFIKYPIH